MIDNIEAPSLDTIEILARYASQKLTQLQAWPKAVGMFAWFGNTRSDDGKRKFTYISHNLWLGTDGRLWTLFSRNWFMHAMAVLTPDEERQLSYARTHHERYVPDGLEEFDVMYPALLGKMLPSPEIRLDFKHKLEEKVAKLEAKKK